MTKRKKTDMKNFTVVIYRTVLESAARQKWQVWKKVTLSFR